MGAPLSKQMRGAIARSMTSDRSRAAGLVHLGTGMPLDEDKVSHRPSFEMQREAWARNSAPRSITSWVCGDPPPGHSALDKRMARA